jgi:rSAM/selenodomain-associated transferase 1
MKNLLVGRLSIAAVRTAGAMKEPALVIMAKAPAVGRTKTRLCPPLTLEQAAALYEALLRDTIGLAAGLEGVQLAIAVTPPGATALLRQWCTPGTILLPVTGTDIGDCLDQVLSRLLASGHSGAMALNSDGPTLPASHLRQAVARLDEADVVLGPGEDGGYYLIGFREPHPGLFRRIDWSTERVTQQTLARAEALGLSVALLPAWYDVDTVLDLGRLRAEIAALPDDAVPHTRRFLDEHDRLQHRYLKEHFPI